MTQVLIIGAVSKGKLEPISLELAAAGQQLAKSLNGKLFGLLIGNDCAEAAASFANAAMDGLYVAEGEGFKGYLGANYLAATTAAIEQCGAQIVLLPQAMEFADLAPRLAARLNAGIVTGCVAFSVEGEQLVATKPVGGGSAMAEYAFNSERKVLLVSGGAFGPASLAGACEIRRLTVAAADTAVKVLEEVPLCEDGGPPLKGARAVVAGGLGLGAQENWRLIDEAAGTLGAAVGGTRAVVELGWIPHNRQVGFSGAKVSPDLYLAIGISGAVHHLAGIKGAKTVVAINTDADASIFRVARFGVVGDAKEVVPAFTARVCELRQARL